MPYQSSLVVAELPPSITGQDRFNAELSERQCVDCGKPIGFNRGFHYVAPMAKGLRHAQCKVATGAVGKV